MAENKNKSNDKTKLLKDTALATIQSALTLIQSYPNIDLTNTNISSNLSINPFDFIFDIIKNTVGFEKFMNWISEYMTWSIIPLEYLAKVTMITNIKNLLGCSINPWISDEILTNGVIIDINDIDINGALNYYPLSNKNDKVNTGAYYYFGCDEMITPNDLLKAKDFNAFLWYVINRSKDRTVWYGYNNQEKSHSSSQYSKQKKEDGIITLEYNESTCIYKNAIGDSMDNQVPFGNSLHVFIGNTKELEDNDNVKNIVQETENNSEKNIAYFNDIAQKSKRTIYAINNAILKNDTKNNKDSNNNNGNNIEKITTFNINKRHQLEHYKNILLDINDISTGKSNKTFSELLNEHKKIIKTATDGTTRIITLPSDIIADEPIGLQILEPIEIPSDVWDTTYNYNSIILNKSDSDINMLSKNGKKYRPIEYNYYYNNKKRRGVNVLKFNTEYIMSLKLYDAKVMTAQLMDAMTNCFSVDINYSLTINLMKEQIKTIIKRVISQTDGADTIISDCFFSFSNDQYNNLLEKTEKMKMGLITTGEKTEVVKGINPEDILKTLNGIDENSEQNVIQTKIKNVLYKLGPVFSQTEIKNKDDSSDSINIGEEFIENLLENLAYVLIQPLLSPKIYMLLLMNIKILGNDSNISFNDFIQTYTNMFVQLITQVTNNLLEFIKEKIMEVISDIIKELVVRLSLEKVQYYYDLLERCLKCFRTFNFNNIDWKQDTVNYADILTDSKYTPETQEC